MSKRYFPQQYGDRKKPKLDVSISDHNFPLSQNVIAGPSKEPDQADTWGDDNDDEILLLASQACEEAYNDLSSLPDYSVCMQQATTSTQLCEPSTSNSSSSNFPFKKPSAIPANVLSTNLKDKCRISSPLLGISSKMAPNSKSDQNNKSDELTLNDKVLQGLDSDLMYRQLVQLQEENAKLMSENGKLQEKCVTKEGESSILRTQLKTCQIAIDNARLERIKAQEKVQTEWTEKLKAATNQMHDLRNQLDFKNLEIISVKEKVRLLESSKVKLRQVTVPAHDISASQRGGNTTLPYSSSVSCLPPGRAHSSTTQTERTKLIKLNVSTAPEPSSLKKLLHLILEPLPETTSLVQNAKLQQHDMQLTKCRVYNTFQRIPMTVVTEEKIEKVDVPVEEFCKDLTVLSGGRCDEEIVFKILKATQLSLNQVEIDLKVIAKKMNNGFQREMDDGYIQSSAKLAVVSDSELLSGRQLFPGEQAILSRRMVAVLPHVLINKAMDMFLAYEAMQDTSHCILDLIHRICNLLDATSSALHYSGLLLSITSLLHHLINADGSTRTTLVEQKTMRIVHSIISSRPRLLVSCRLLAVLRKLIGMGYSFDQLCPGGVQGNLRMDYEQGVLLFKKDSCHVQVLLKQIEMALKCIEKEALCCMALEVTQNLILLHANSNGIQSFDSENKCDCGVMLMQVLVYALKICAVLVGVVETAQRLPGNGDQLHRRVTAVCAAGVTALYQWALRDPGFGPRLGHDEGHSVHFIEIVKDMPLLQRDTYASMLLELSSVFQPPEDVTSSYTRQPWLKSFDSFLDTD